MKLEDQCVSLELAKRLKELGVKQESLFYWVHPINEWKLTIVMNEADKIYFNNCILDKFSMEYYSAFTVAELGEMLPEAINENFIKSQKKDDEYKIYINYIEKCTIFFSKNEADARAKMLIYLIENKLMEI